MDQTRISNTKKAIYLATAVLTSVLIIRFFFLDSFIVIGDSMAPTLQNGDYIFVNKLAYLRKDPARLDIVVVNFRGMSDKKAIKRVVALPNEWVFIENGTVYYAESRDSERIEVGKLDKEAFTAEISENYTYRLDPHEYFLLGDNGLVSVDSRSLGPVDEYHIEGRVTKIIKL